MRDKIPIRKTQTLFLRSLPATRKEAREKGSTRYYTGKPCTYGHVASRMTSTATCNECAKAFKRKEREVYMGNKKEGKQ